MKKLLIAAGLALLLASPAEAREWKIDYKNSSLGFEGSQTGALFTGKFESYIAKVDFDPDHPETSKINVQIDMRTAITGDKQRDTALPQPEWFDAANFNFAEFTSRSVKKLGENDYEIDGQLKIKLVTKDVKLPFHLATEKDGKRATGTLTIDRTDYTIGTGEWLSDQYVGKPVKITISLMAY